MSRSTSIGTTSCPITLALRMLATGEASGVAAAACVLRAADNAPRCDLHPLARVGVVMADDGGGLHTLCAECNAQRSAGLFPPRVDTSSGTLAQDSTGGRGVAYRVTGVGCGE